MIRAISKRLVMTSIAVRAWSVCCQLPHNSIIQGPMQSVATSDHGTDLASRGAKSPY